MNKPLQFVIKLEELAMLGSAIYFLTQLQVEWWWYLALVLGPDISMLGYLGGNRSGAFLYNLAHHKGVGLAFIIAGLITQTEVVQATGLVLFGHSSMDRVLGYGLKTVEGFKYTHLGIIGKK